MNTDPTQLLNRLISWGISFVLLLLLLAVVGVFFYMFIQWLKNRRREDYALQFVTLLVRLPRENEIKIDAAEQMFAGLYSLKKSGFLQFMKPEDLFSFEIVALKEKIEFHVNCPRNIRDLVEKQIHGAYPSAEIKEIDEG